MINTPDRREFVSRPRKIAVLFCFAILFKAPPVLTCPWPSVKYNNFANALMMFFDLYAECGWLCDVRGSIQWRVPFKSSECLVSLYSFRFPVYSVAWSSPSVLNSREGAKCAVSQTTIHSSSRLQLSLLIAIETFASKHTPKRLAVLKWTLLSLLLSFWIFSLSNTKQ